MTKVAGFAARVKGSGEGRGLFAAKRGVVPVGGARGIEVEMFFCGSDSVPKSGREAGCICGKQMSPKKNIVTESPTARGGANVPQRWFIDAFLRRLEALPPKPRRLAQIKNKKVDA